MIETNAQQSKDGSFVIPERLNAAFIMHEMGWSWADYRQCPAHVLDEIRLFLHATQLARK